jgi:hypothetical protein
MTTRRFPPVEQTPAGYVTKKPSHPATAPLPHRSERERASKNLLRVQTKSAVMTKTTSAASSGITVEYPREPRQSLSSVDTVSKNQHTIPAVTIAASPADIGNM